MADFATVIQNLRDDNQFIEAARVPDIQFFGPRNRRFLAAELMPEQLRENNAYREEDFHLIDVVASDIDRYSPPPFKGSFVRAGQFLVELGDSGLSLQMGTAMYSRIVAMLGRAASMDRVAAQFLEFNGSIINGMLIHNERQRWDAIRNAVVNRVIDETTEVVQYPNSSGQRVALVDAWSDPTYDPIPDFFAQTTRASELGYPGVARIIATQDVVDILQANPLVQDRIGNVRVVGAAGSEREFRDFADVSQLDAYLRANRLPAIEVFDETYRDQDGSHRYLPTGTIIFIYSTGRQTADLMEEEDVGELFIPANGGAGIGYTGIGTNAGHEDLGPGRYTELVFHGGTRPAVVGAGVQKGLPVFTEPNGFAVYTNIH